MRTTTTRITRLFLILCVLLTHRAAVAAGPPGGPGPRVVEPDASGVLHINIYRDFDYAPTGWPMGLSSGQTRAAGLSDAPMEALVRQPVYSSPKPLYGYLRLGNTEDTTVSFVLDEVEKPGWALYVDRNNNEDLTDDGAPVRNKGTLKMSATVALDVDIAVPGGARMTAPYQIWFFVNGGVPAFYATCHWAGRLRINGAVYGAVAFEETGHDGLYKENGVCIDINKDGKCEKETELLMDGEGFRTEGKEYRVRLEYP
ncbi:MAG: hypothetical protein HY894_00530 [Deltaproteobacteria bacterium]|nr:hypothetical protein [Deltaproteobacteria bacterium]